MDKFDEYRFFVESTEKLSERRQNATQTYLTVSTAIFAVLAFLVKDSGFRGWGLVLVSLPLFSVGLVACIIWYKIIQQYKVLIKWRYEKLVEMEQSPTLLNLVQFYAKERENFYSLRSGRERFGFSRLEIWLPMLFMGLYLAYAVILVIVTLVGKFQ